MTDLSTVTTEPPPSVDWPVYRKVPHETGALFFVVADEGCREWIVCEHMESWAADWLIKVLDRRPYAVKERP